MNLTRPPFQIVPGQSAEAAAIEIVNTFLSISTLPQKVSHVFKTLTGCLKLDQSDPLIAAGYNLAETIDATAAIYDRPYHNGQHTCEVMLSSYFLSLLEGLSQQEMAELVLAALCHDFQHDGKPSEKTPFRLERQSVNQTVPYWIATGINNAQQQKLTALILATHTSIGLPIAYACYVHHTNQDTSIPEIPSSVSELAMLCRDPLTSRQALILCAADILPSLGLTVEYALKLQGKLAAEWGVPLDIDDKLRFIDKQRLWFFARHFFNPNIDRLRSSILNKYQEHHAI